MLNEAILSYLLVTSVATKETKCLAANVYHEARGEPLLGQLAVAQVTLNRVKSPKYPKSICKVVYEPKQFSWVPYRDKNKFDNMSLAVAQLALSGNHKLKTFKATHYHNQTVRPDWKMKQVAKIGQHTFYKESK